MLGNKGIGDFFQVAVHHKIQFVQGEVDTVVGHAALGVVVGTDALAAVAAADEGFAFGSLFGLGFAFFARRLSGQRGLSSPALYWHAGCGRLGIRPPCLSASG